MGIFIHIIAVKQGGPRYSSAYPTEKLNDETNIFLLCGTHHKIVDDHPEKYTVDVLRKMKANHEREVRQRMIEDVGNLDFREIEQLLQHIKSSPQNSKSSNWSLISINEKIKRNQLSDSSRDYLKIGLLKVQEVKEYIEFADSSIPYFSEKIRQFFISRYLDIKTREEDPDSIFLSLLSCIEGDDADFGRRAAALAVLTYLFERCEVFEK